MSDSDLQQFRAEAIRHPECVECRTILRLLEEVSRLRAVEDEWIAGQQRG